MVLCRAPESRCGRDLRHDWTSVFGLLAVARRDRRSLLLRVVEENRRTVLIPDVGSLTVQLRWVVNLPEDIEELFVGDALRIVRDLDRLGMAGGVAADLAVCRILQVTAGVAGNGVDDAGNLAKR